ncbi:LptF/LptG family permease [Marivirga arenosa]|uniref:LptF/LptG family permease n=1 Tax=Marivirga arenosa TaxID=3059076 RepID=A0AA51X4I1_9BACT|nr:MULTISPECIES: LptF/LptG family permease [unclassified Marivirga]WMN06844.1 LptF/LptG family permease [Marivirga sp. ABR2-2]WNB16830.1 LptF/LptG family permease [Marivirga sp. BKB1-2]
MKLLDKYILKKFLSTFIFVVLIILAIVTVIDYTEKNDDFMEHNLSLLEILPYYGAFIPWIGNLITPITIFIAAVFVTSKMAGHTEIVAMLASGMSFRRFLFPYMLGAGIVGLASFFLNAYIIPDANKTRIAFETAYVKKPFYFTDRDIHLKIAPNTYAYMESYNNQRDVGYRFTLELIEDKILKEKLSARRIEWDSAQSKWKVRDWDLRKFNGMEEIVEKGREMDTVLNITPKDFGNTYGLQETLTLSELNDYISLLKERGADNVKIYLIERYIRFMAPFAAIILTFIGVVVSSKKKRGGTGFQIALGFVIAFVFIIFFILSKAIAENSSMNPILAVWLPNITFSIVGLILYKFVPR